MQVVSPIDIEDALRIDLDSLIDGVRFFAPPLPPDLKANDVVIERVGGSGVSGSSHEYDVTVGCYADNEAAAMALSNMVQGYLVSLPFRDTQTQYSNANANMPYSDFDPRAQNLVRNSFRATVICPGQDII